MNRLGRHAIHIQPTHRTYMPYSHWEESQAHSGHLGLEKKDISSAEVWQVDRVFFHSYLVLARKSCKNKTKDSDSPLSSSPASAPSSTTILFTRFVCPPCAVDVERETRTDSSCRGSQFARFGLLRKSIVNGWLHTQTHVFFLRLCLCSSSSGLLAQCSPVQSSARLHVQEPTPQWAVSLSVPSRGSTPLSHASSCHATNHQCPSPPLSILLW